MTRFNILFSLLLVLLLASCHSIASKSPLIEAPVTIQQSPLIHLGTLDQESSDKEWEQFFKERGALAIWQELKQKKEQVNIRLEKLEEPLVALPNQADQIGAGIIHYLTYHNPTVEELRISSDYNGKYKLGTLSPAIGNLTNLTSLSLTYNQLSSLPSEIGNLANLRSLYLQYNTLTTLPSEIDNLANLEVLQLFNNQLTTLPSEIGDLANLRSLLLHYNRLKTLPAELGKLTKLNSLCLANNQLSTLPLELFNLTNLKDLHLASNQLSTLPLELGNLVNLTMLYLSSNPLNSLPSEVTKLTNLKTLSLENISLSTLSSNIGHLTKLAELNLSSNRLGTLPSVLNNLTNLTKLEFQNNQLTALSARLDPYLQTLLTKGQYGRIDNNPWLQAKYLTGPIDCATLLAYTHHKLSQSLVPTFGQFAPQIPKFLSLTPEQVAAKMPLVQGKLITYFQKLKEESVPFYWDYGIYTNQDVENTLEALKDKHLFLLSEDKVKK